LTAGLQQAVQWN